MARRKNLVSQLFARYWGIDNENLEPNTKFFVTENVANEAAALNIADSYMIDRGISQNFFQTDFRMNEDLLSTMTTRYLNSLCPTPGAYCQESSLYGPKAASSGCSDAQNAQMQMSYVDFVVTVIASIALGVLGTVALSCWRRGSELLGFTEIELKSETEQNSI